MVLSIHLAGGQAQTVSDPSYANMQRAVGSIVEHTAQARGFSTTDPRTYGTMYGMGKVAVSGAVGAGAGALIGGTAPAWATVLLVAGVTAGVGYAVNLAIDGLVKWAFGDLNSATPLIVTKPGGGSVSGTPYPGQTIEAGESYTLLAGAGNSWYAGDCSGSDVMAVISCLYPDGPSYFYPGAHWGAANSINANTACVSVMAPLGPGGSYIEIGCPGATLAIGTPSRCAVGSASKGGGQCRVYATNNNGGDETVTEPASMSDAVAMVQAELSKQVSSDVLALLVNQLWKQAASQQGYDGLPYTMTQPITAVDVDAWRAVNPSLTPTVGDLLAPVPSPSTGLVPSTNTGTATGPTGGTSTNPGSNSPTVNLGPDPNIGSPALEGAPTARAIIDPLLNLMPDLKQWTSPSHASECPRPTFDFFGKPIRMDSMCELAEQNRSLIFTLMLAAFGLAAIMVILTA